MKYIKKFERRRALKIDFPKEIKDFALDVSKFISKNVKGLNPKVETLSQYINVALIEIGKSMKYGDYEGLITPVITFYYNHDNSYYCQFQAVNGLMPFFNRNPEFRAIYDYLHDIIPKQFSSSEIPIIKVELDKEKFELYKSTNKYNL